MPNDPLVLALLAIVAVAGGIFLVGGGRGWVLAVLLTARSLTDIGASAGGSLLPSSTLSFLLSGCLLVVCLLPQRHRVSARLAVAVVFSLLALAIWMVIAWLQFGVTIGPLREAARLASYIAVLVVAYRSAQEHPDRLPSFVAVATLVPGLLLIGGFAAGWAPTINGASRAVGSFSHANAAGSYFAIAGIVALAEFWRTRRKVLVFAVSVAVVALLLTQSMGNIVGLGFALIVLILFNSQISLPRRVFLTVASGVVAVTLFNLLGASSRLAELEGLNASTALSSGVSNNSLEWRLINWDVLLRMWWEQQPLLGFGLGTSSTTVMPLGAPPHSLPVQIAVETGVVGIAVVLTLAVAFAAAARRRPDAQRIQIAMLVALVGFCLLSGSTSNLIGYSAAGYLVFLVIGFTLGQTRVAPTPTTRQRLAASVPEVRR